MRVFNSCYALSLRDNKIKHLPKEIGDMARLTELFLQGNELEYLPQALSKSVCARVVVVVFCVRARPGLVSTSLHSCVQLPLCWAVLVLTGCGVV